MKSAFRIYSDILQLRGQAFFVLKHAHGGMRYAAVMFFLVMLTAGAGLWIGLPALLQRPLIVEQIDQVSALVDRFDREVVPTLNASLDAVSQENLSIALADLLPANMPASADILSDIINQSGLTAAQLTAALSAESVGLSAEARAQVATQVEALGQAMQDQGVVTPAQVDALLAQTPLSADQVAGLLANATAVQGELDQLRAQAVQQAPQLEQFLAQIPLSTAQFQTLLMRTALTPERVSSMTLQLGLTPEQIGNLRANIDAAPVEANSVLADLRAAVAQFHPPLGVRTSRFVHMFGEWISTPFTLMANWAFFGLMLLVTAKALGGTGTMRQHLIALLLASAPLFLLFFTYVPVVSPPMSIGFNLAFDYFGRILALVGVGWAGLVLLKSMSVTHELSLWRSFAVVALTWVVIYVVMPVISFAALGYVLRA